MSIHDSGTLRVAIYARYSSDKQRESSIEDQVRRCREYALRCGLKISEQFIFKDEAISGASLARAGFDAMMTLATARPRQIDVILAEDQSRISRDIADAATVFKKLQFAGVELVCVADGINTTHRGSKLAFTVKSLLSDLYLDDLRDKTLRGLEGRALAGFSTGSLPYGYRSVVAVGADGRELGKRIEIDEEAAVLVRGIFADYLAGHSLNTLARGLNAREVRAPRAGSRHRRQGWVASTVRVILHNEKYAGEWRFKERQWVKEPGTNIRRPRMRPADEVIRQDRPELRIIDADTWEQTRRRLAQVHTHYTRNADGSTKGRGFGGRGDKYLLSGLLECGECGAPMIIIGGERRFYRCGDYTKRGTCKNSLGVREQVAKEKILDAVREYFSSPVMLSYVRMEMAKVLGDSLRLQDAELAERRSRLARTEQRIAGLVRFIADGDHSPTVRVTLRDLEAQANVEKAAIVELEEAAIAPIELPSPRELKARLVRLEKALAGNVLAGRESLRRIFAKGAIRMEPHGAHYVARASILPLVLIKESAAQDEPGRPMNTCGSGGPICRILHAISRGFSVGLGRR